MLSVFLLLLLGFFAGSIYAAESEVGENVTEGTYKKNSKTYECLSSVSDGGYLQITQIVPNSSNVKISTYVDDSKLLISGVVNKGTEITIKVYNSGVEQGDPYSLVSTGTFSQSLEVEEGVNKIVIAYANKNDGIADHIMIEVTRAEAESINKIKDFLVTA